MEPMVKSKYKMTMVYNDQDTMVQNDFGTKCL